MAEGGCSCSRCIRRTNSNADDDVWSRLAEISDNETGQTSQQHTTDESELHETPTKEEGDTQPSRSSTFLSFTKRLSRRLSFTRSRGSSVESNSETSPRNNVQRRRRKADLEKRKSWSGFRTQSRAEETEGAEFSMNLNRRESRRTTWYDRFRGVFDLRPNDVNTTRNTAVCRGQQPPRLPERDPFGYPLTEESFRVIRRDHQFADVAQMEYKMEYFLVPDLLAVTKCPWYWGKINRYQAEKVLEGLPDGTYLLRDSAQYNYLFSVSFRRYSRTYHARVEQWRHQYGFDKPGDQSFYTEHVCDLVKHYSRPEQCMYYEPLLLKPLARKNVLSLQQLCRGVICDCVGFQGVLELPLPKQQKAYLREFHYKVPVRRKMESKATQTQLVRSRKFGMPWSS